MISRNILFGKDLASEIFEGLRYEKPIPWNLTLILMGKLPFAVRFILSKCLKMTGNEWLAR